MDNEKLKIQEDEVIKLVAAMPKSMQLTVYEILHNGYACTMVGIEYARIKAFNKENEPK